MLTDREAVRMTLMRGTVHLVTVRDALMLRPLVQVVIERGHNGAFGRRMGGADPAELAAAVRELLADEPLTGRELGRRLGALDALLEERPFLSGRAYGLADVAYFPWLPRAQARLGVDLEAYAAVRAWFDALAERPAIAAELELVAAAR
jgi:glutathione S-transferase